MNEEIRTLNHFEEAGFNGGQSKAMVVGIDDLLVKSMAAFHEYFDHRFNALEHRFNALEHRFSAIDHRFSTIDHRFNVLENSVRSNHTQINVLIGIQFALAGLLVAVLVAMLFGGR